MKIKKDHFFKPLLRLLVRLAVVAVVILISWYANRDRAPYPTPSQETQPVETSEKTCKPNKKKAPKPSSAEPTRKKRNKRNNNKRSVSASRRKKAEQEAADRRADLECLLYEDNLN